jgi:hypothetical protein
VKKKARKKKNILPPFNYASVELRKADLDRVIDRIRDTAIFIGRDYYESHKVDISAETAVLAAIEALKVIDRGVK